MLAVNGSTHHQNDGVEAYFACGLPQVLTQLAALSIGGFVLTPRSGIFAELPQCDNTL